MSSTPLAARYGRLPEQRRRRRVIAIAGAVLAAALFIVWVVWTGYLVPGPTLEPRLIGYTILDEDRVEIRFEVSATPGNDIVCALAAQDDRHAIVGWKVLEIPAGEQFTRHFQETVVTSQPSGAGLISTCRFA